MAGEVSETLHIYPMKKPKESKSLQRYRTRIEQLEQHMEAVDVCISLALSATKAKKNDSTTILKSLDKNHPKYKRLNHPAGEAPRVFNFSKSQNFAYSLIALYRHFGEYLRGILEEMYNKNPLAIVGKAEGASLKFHELVELGNYEDIVKKMVDSTFRRLEEERSTIKLLDKIIGHTKVTIDKSIKDNAIRNLELRHLFIHNNGKCDAKFEKAYGTDFGIKEHDDLPTDYATTSSAIESVTKLLKEIDHALLKGNFIPCRING